MDRPRIQMSYEEFDTIERLLGWKTEYWDGYARLTPRQMGIETRLKFESVDVSGNDNSKKLTLVTPTANYTQRMIDGYIESFINSIEFCGWPINRIFEEAHQDISLYFEGKRGKPLSASTIALEAKTERVIAIALITNKKEKGPCLELLYVRPSYQRKGIATHMLHRSIHKLTQQGYSQLTSRYHICNHRSRQFYHKLGFQDIHDHYYLRTYVAWLGNEIYRREKLKMLDGIVQMKQEQKQLQEKIKVLEEEFLRSVREASKEN